MAELLNIFLVGFSVLIAAILANILATVLGLTTWFTYAAAIREVGILAATKQAGFFSLLFMYVLYPLLLGYVPITVLELLK